MERTTPVLGLAWGGRSLYDEADALAGGKPVVVAARVGGEDDEPAVATFATRENVLELDIGAHVPDDAALASVATDAGRMLHADAVIVVDDDDRDAREILAAAREGRDLPRVLWTATGAGFEDASRRPRRAERQWDGALLLVADVKPDAGPPPGQRARAAGGHPEVEPADKVLYLTADAGRFFLVPAGHELAPGDLRVVSLTGEERLADPAALGAVEVSRDGAEAHLRALAQRSVSAAADVVGRAVGLAGLGEALPDLPAIADRLGTREQRDPQAAKAALEALTADMHAISAALASGAGADLDAARERLARRGIDLGDTLDDLPGYVAAIRRLEQDSAAQVAARGLRAMADAIEGEPESLGRRIDELIARLEREVGPFLGADPQRRTRERQERYARSARSAIGDALRARGITPLATDEPDEPPPTDAQPATDAPRDERKPS